MTTRRQGGSNHGEGSFLFFEVLIYIAYTYMQVIGLSI